MKQAIYGLILLAFLALPPARELAESIMSIHMHMQMPLIAVSGFLLTPFLQKTFPNFFAIWIDKCLLGFVLDLVVILYCMIPKAMDDAFVSGFVEFMKFLSWWLMGVSLRDCWGQASYFMKNAVVFTIGIIYIIMAGVYIF